MNNIIEQMKAATLKVRGEGWALCSLSVSKYTGESDHHVRFQVMTEAANGEGATLEEALAAYAGAASPAALLAKAEAMETEARKLRELSARQAA